MHPTADRTRPSCFWKMDCCCVAQSGPPLAQGEGDGNLRYHLHLDLRESGPTLEEDDISDGSFIY